MALQCPRCRRQYDVTLFQFGRPVRCECGATVDLARGHVVEQEVEVLEPQVEPRPQAVGAGPLPPQLILVRHAEADADGDLTERGLDQTLALAGRFLTEAVAAIYVADASCCQQTAAPIASELGVRVQAAPLLGEGDAAGALAFLRDALRGQPHGSILAVTHESVCRAVLGRTLGIPEEQPATFRVDPASVHRIEVTPAGWRVAVLNDRCHLDLGS